MALTQEQLDNIEYLKAQTSVTTRMEALRIAKDVLTENDRNKPVGDRGITASDITTFADTLIQYTNQ